MLEPIEVNFEIDFHSRVGLVTGGGGANAAPSSGPLDLASNLKVAETLLKDIINEMEFAKRQETLLMSRNGKSLVCIQL